MPFRKAENGGLYGTIGVLLTRMVGDESEEHFGHQSPWGGIQVEIDTYHAPTGRRRTGWTSTEYVEKPQEWWGSAGMDCDPAAPAGGSPSSEPGARSRGEKLMTHEQIQLLTIVFLALSALFSTATIVLQIRTIRVWRRARQIREETARLNEEEA